MSDKDITEVGASAAASKTVLYPNEDAYSAMDKGFLLFEMLD